MWKSVPNNPYCPVNWAKYKIVHLYFSNFCLNFKSTFTILKESMNDFWNDFKRTPLMAASANMFYIAIGYKNRANMKVAARLDTNLLLNNVQTILVKISIKLILTVCLSNSFFNSFMKMKNEKRTVFRFPFLLWKWKTNEGIKNSK